MLQPGDRALDATAGNGHDTVFLARRVGPQGHVWACDTQPEALAATAERLREAGIGEAVTLIRTSHHRLLDVLPAMALGRLKAIQFNLGYRPGGDRRHITGPATTVPALEAATRLLHPEGRISLLVYRGHPGGEDEYQAIIAWLSHVSLSIERLKGVGESARAPVLFLLGHG